MENRWRCFKFFNPVIYISVYIYLFSFNFCWSANKLVVAIPISTRRLRIVWKFIGSWCIIWMCDFLQTRNRFELRGRDKKLALTGLVCALTNMPPPCHLFSHSVSPLILCKLVMSEAYYWSAVYRKTFWFLIVWGVNTKALWWMCHLLVFCLFLGWIYLPDGLMTKVFVPRILLFLFI